MSSSARDIAAGSSLVLQRVELSFSDAFMSPNFNISNQRHPQGQAAENSSVLLDLCVVLRADSFMNFFFFYIIVFELSC